MNHYPLKDPIDDVRQLAEQGHDPDLFLHDVNLFRKHTRLTLRPPTTFRPSSPPGASSEDDGVSLDDFNDIPNLSLRQDPGALLKLFLATVPEVFGYICNHARVNEWTRPSCAEMLTELHILEPPPQHRTKETEIIFEAINARDGSSIFPEKRSPFYTESLADTKLLFAETFAEREKGGRPSAAAILGESGVNVNPFVEFPDGLEARVAEDLGRAVNAELVGISREQEVCALSGMFFEVG